MPEKRHGGYEIACVRCCGGSSHGYCSHNFTGGGRPIALRHRCFSNRHGDRSGGRIRFARVGARLLARRGNNRCKDTAHERCWHTTFSLRFSFSTWGSVVYWLGRLLWLAVAFHAVLTILLVRAWLYGSVPIAPEVRGSGAPDTLGNRPSAEVVCVKNRVMEIESSESPASDSRR